MGHYTGFKGKLVLKPELPESYLAILKFMLWMDNSRDSSDNFLSGFENHLENLLVSIQDEPNTAFFISKYWSSILLGSEPVMFPYSYRSNEPGSFASLDERPDGRYEIAWASSGRYQWIQLEQFLHWLVPYLDNEGNEEPILIAQSCYEHSNALYEAFLVGDKVHWSLFAQKRDPEENQHFGCSDIYDEGDVYHAFSEIASMEDHGRDWDKMDAGATVLSVDGIEYRKAQWTDAMEQRKFSLRQFRDSRRLVTSLSPIDQILDGGLEMSRTSLWFAPKFHFGLGHQINTMILAMINNRPPEDVVYRTAMFVSPGQVDHAAMEIYRQLYLHKNGSVDQLVVDDVDKIRDYVRGACQELGWGISLLAPNVGEVSGQVFEDILKAVHGSDLSHLKLVFVENIDEMGLSTITSAGNLESFNAIRKRHDFHLMVGAPLPNETARSFRTGDWFGRESEWLEHVIAENLVDVELAEEADMTFVQRMDDGVVYFASSKIGATEKSFQLRLAKTGVYEKDGK